MKPIEIGNYSFRRMYLWLQYSKWLPNFTEIVIEVFYPNDRQAEGLVMFNHGFLIGWDLTYYPKLLLSKLAGGDTPLYQIDPSWYYNYSEAAKKHNWALAFVTACHKQVGSMPWTDFVGNPRVGQEAYAAASYLIRYGATYNYHEKEEVEKYRFLKQQKGNKKSNRVIFAGHSVGGAHAQAAATGFDNLQRTGLKEMMPFDPVFYNREVVPGSTPQLSAWDESQRAEPVGLLQLSPVDKHVPILLPGMEQYRRCLADMQMPNLMVTGACDTACLKDSDPPAWIGEQDRTSQFARMAYGSDRTWAAICNVDRGSHCGYLRHRNDLCSQADKSDSSLTGCNGTPYKAKEEEYLFTQELMDRYIGFVSEKANPDFDEWKNGSLITWLNKETPENTQIQLRPFTDGYVHFA